MINTRNFFKTFTYASIFALSSFSLQPAIASDTEDASVLEISGNAEILVQPDMAIVLVGAAYEEANPETARNKVEKAITSFIDSLSKIKISDKDFVAQSISVMPVYNYVDGKRISRGYSAKRFVSINVNDLDKISDVIDSALQSGLNQISRIEYTLKDKTKAIENVRELAIKDAISKAQAIAKGFNVKLKKVKRISYESQHGRVATYSDTVMSNKARLNSAQGVSAVYKADDISLSDYVRVVYEIENE